MCLVTANNKKLIKHINLRCTRPLPVSNQTVPDKHPAEVAAPEQKREVPLIYEHMFRFLCPEEKYQYLRHHKNVEISLDRSEVGTHGSFHIQIEDAIRA